MIADLDMEKLKSRDSREMARLARAVTEVGFLTVSNTALDAERVAGTIAAYRAFFRLPDARKAAVDMARTGSNRGWGRPGSEQVDPQANPDFKQVFDCGYELPADHPLQARGLSVYAPNLWPEDLPDFGDTIRAYYCDALAVAMDLLRAISLALGEAETAFDAAFDPPMALLRGNYYPPRPDWAGEKDFGIAAHTDYGCLTLLAADGTPGLEVRMPDGEWAPVTAGPGRFVINFGEMLELWSGGRIKATEHRVIGGPEERISVPLFFNPAHDANVATPGATGEIRAGDHLTRRFRETYVHLQHGAG
ncbi:isopenicillin N synthase family dioxygenase [Pseudodonghicola flavimaris]|uniref:2-oxoglutarate-dependent ethylene/succinate-forming enzyme n=1 Tax=Pseudodonghicola flavimaris TaxID=3050036 RepID=A0ABT7F526_9RHOB|nr:2-oxoglutarate and iron-dependent oxygenase domain-containing protein [Pseudodonghicola flavimaris]MDK3019720.1 2-oxoglutarate and iron-dependent oxygenase domain-containing protein [Pseudodonghicola flavimaris]